MSSQEKVLVFLNQGLGDVLMALPALNGILKNHPRAQFLLFAKGAVERDMLKFLGYDNKVELFDFMTTNYVALSFRLLREKVDYWYCPHAFQAKKYYLLSKLINAKKSVGPMGQIGQRAFTHPISHTAKMHKVDFYLKAADCFNEGDTYSNQMVLAPDFLNSLAPVTTQGKKYIVIAPGSGPNTELKQWPTIQWSACINAILAEYSERSVYLLGVRAESALLEKIKEGVNLSDRFELFYPKSLQDSFSLIHHADALLGVCNGSSHIAVAADTPVLTLYGPTNPGFTGTFSSKACRIVADNEEGLVEDMSQINVETVMKGLSNLLSTQYDVTIPWRATESFILPFSEEVDHA